MASAANPLSLPKKVIDAAAIAYLRHNFGPTFKVYDSPWEGTVMSVEEYYKQMTESQKAHLQASMLAILTAGIRTWL